VNQIHITQEDGFYYFKIAENLARGYGSTFDGIDLTNGYQPLWLFCLVPIFWLTTSPDVALQLGIVLQALFFAATVILLYATARLNLGRVAAISAALLWIAFVYAESLKGLEFSLHAFGIATVAYLYLRWFSSELPRDTRLYFALGLAFSLTFLARLDTLLLAAILIFFISVRAWRSRSLKLFLPRVVILSAPLIITAISYVVINIFVFGEPFPISGWVKETWSQYLLAQDAVYQTRGWIVAKANQLLWTFDGLNRVYPLYMTLGTFGIAGLWLVNAFTQSAWLSENLRRWSPFIAYSLISFVGIALSLHDSLLWAPWYYVMQPWLAVMLIAALVERLTYATRVDSNIWMRGFAFATIAIGLTIPTLHTIQNLDELKAHQAAGEIPEPLYDGARWASTHLPSDAVIGAWNAGTIGYFSNRRVVNLDGVVNTYDFFDTERFDLCRYWREHNITYLVDAFEGQQALSVIPTLPAYAQCVQRLEPIWSDNHYGASWHLQVYRIR
jgi:hypothetical protein